MMMQVLQILAAVMLLAGSFFSLAAAIGLVRLPDLFTRMHAASKAGPVGAGLLLVAAGIYSGDLAVLARSVAGFFFLILTTPISAHLLARASIIAGNNPQEHKLRNQKKSGKTG